LTQQNGEAIDSQTRRAGASMLVWAVAVLISAWTVLLLPMLKFQFWQPDTFWLIEVGRLILATHALPVHDPYSFTASAPHWYVYQWLTEVIFSVANSLGGLTGVAIFGEALLAFLFCILIFRRMLKENTNPLIAIALVCTTAWSFYPYIAALRPQLISFVLFWLLVMVCADCKKPAGEGSPRPILKALVPTFLIAVLWANCHLSFAIGVILLGAQLLGEVCKCALKLTGRKSAILFLAMLLTFLAGTLVTPLGVSLWTFLLVDRSYSAIPNPELEPLNWFAQPNTILLIILSCLYLRKEVELGELFTLAALLLVGNNCGRLIIYFYMFGCPLMGRAATHCFLSRFKLSMFPKLSAALKSVALSPWYPIGVLLLSGVYAGSQPVFMRSNIPVQAAKYIAAHRVDGNLFCDAQCGSYLIYATHGAMKVFFDTRLDLYDKDFVLRFIKAYNLGEGWQDLFAQYKIAAALLPNEIKLSKILAEQPDWEGAYHDSDFTLYTLKKK